MVYNNRTYLLSEWLDEWFAIYKQSTLKCSSQKRDISTIRLIKQSIYSKYELSKIEEKHIQLILNDLQKVKYKSKKCYSKSSLKKVKSVLNQSFREAKRQHLIEYNICEEVVVPKAKTNQVLPLTHDQQERVELACSTERYGNIFIFLLYTGLRQQEVRHLKWSDYHENHIHIRHSKTPAGIRTVNLINKAVEIIKAQPRISEYIFTNTKGNIISPNSLAKAYLRLRKSSLVPSLTCHVCRHTFVTRLCEKGVSAKAISQIIGHENANYVLDIYAKLEKSELRKAIYVLDTDYESNNILAENYSADIYKNIISAAFMSNSTIEEFVVEHAIK